jgi:hypothetical protein
MTLQDFFPADLTLLGLRNRYSQVGKDSFLVNSPCVIAKDKTLTKGKHYLIFNIQAKTCITLTEIVLIDLFCYKSHIHLIAEDISTHRVSIVSFCLECPQTNCTKFLVDIKYFIQRMNERAIKDYCGDCNKDEKKSVKGISTKSSHDDLLEFEF